MYITTNLCNGKRYIGQKQFDQENWKNYLGSGAILKKAIKKYGKENFSRNIIQICYSKKELNDVEYRTSVILNVVESNDWYNLCYGGGSTNGYHFTEETRKKMGEKAKQRLSDARSHPRYGKEGLSGKNNPQYGISPKERMSSEKYQQWYDNHKKYWEKQKVEMKGKRLWGDAPPPMLGKTLSDEAKRKISQKAKQRFSDPRNCTFYGRHHSEESKKKLSESRKGYKASCCKPVYSIEYDKIFWGSTEVENLYKICASSVTACCRGRRKSIGKHIQTNEKLHWLYVDDAIKQQYITQQQLDAYLDNLKMERN